MEIHEIEKIVELTLIKLGLLTPYVSQAQAFRAFGRGNVQNWHKQGWIEYLRDKDNGHVRILRSQLEEVAARNNVLVQFMHPKKQIQLIRDKQLKK